MNKSEYPSIHLPIFIVRWHRPLILVFLLTFLIVLYKSYLIRDPLIQRDDIELIYPIKSLTSFTEYINAVQKNDILDVQPLRDLSFYFNVRIFELTGLSTFHIFNFLFFIFSVFLFFKILQRLNFTKNQTMTGLIIFAIHPVMICSVGWISARKHSLGLIFILLATYDFLKSERLSWKSCLFLSLSLMSHQIFGLWSIWILIYGGVKRLKLSMVSKLSILSVSGIIMGIGIYKTFILKNGNNTYQYYSNYENLSRYVLSLGRSTSLIVFPSNLSAIYSQSNPLNLIGIASLVVILFFFYKSANRRNIFLWLLLAGLIHLPTFITFVHESYLFLPLICFLISIFYFINGLHAKYQRWLPYITGFYICYLAYQTVLAASMWEDDKKLWLHSHKSEESPVTSIMLGAEVIKYDKKLGYSLMNDGMKDFDRLSNRNVLSFYMEEIYKSDLPIHEKIGLFKEFYTEHDVWKMTLGLLLLEGDATQQREGVDLLKKLKLNTQDLKPGSIGHNGILRIIQICQTEPSKMYICEDLHISFKGI